MTKSKCTHSDLSGRTMIGDWKIGDWKIGKLEVPMTKELDRLATCITQLDNWYQTVKSSSRRVRAKALEHILLDDNQRANS